jgi:hypothetical protein
MMAQVFQYPNLITGTRSGSGWFLDDGSGAIYNPGTGIELYNAKPTEDFLYSSPVVLHKDTDYTLHCFAANTSNMRSTEMWVLDMGKVPDGYNWIGSYALLDTPGPRGWLDATFRLGAQARDGVPFNIRFDNNGSTDGENCLIWFRDVMLVEGTEPAAWAPAEGETLAGGDALVSANLLDGIEPTIPFPQYVTESDGVLTSSVPTDNWYDLAYWYPQTPTQALAENQTMHLGISAKWHGAAATAGTAWASVKYEDSAGNANSVNAAIDGITTEWKRFSLSVVVPSGMRVVDFHISAQNLDAGYDATNPTLSYGSPVTLASSAHTPYATQDHVAAEYATKASLKVTDDKITSEVSERTKLSGRVGTLESTSSEHATKITQLSSSIESMVKGEATYTAPDGTTKTNGLYSKIEQTADGINETFGQYTKTEDLASTAAVKDAKKAGTDAASAASAAQSTADTAKANAETAQTTANTAVTNASTAQSTANSAKSTADNLATLIHEGEDGISVGKSADGKTFTQGRTHMGNSSFDVLDKNGTVVASLASGKVSLLGGDVSMTAYTDGSGQTKYTDCDINSKTSISMSGGSYANSTTDGLGSVSASTAGASITSYDSQGYSNAQVSVGDDGFARVYGRKGVAISSDEGGMKLNGGTSIKKIFAGTSVVKSLGSDFDLFSGDACKSRFGELVMPDEHASWVLLASPGQGSYDHHITLSPTSGGGVHGYITPSVTGNVRVQWLFIKF